LLILLVIVTLRVQSARQEAIFQWEVDMTLAEMRGQQQPKPLAKARSHPAEFALWGITVCNTLGIVILWAAIFG
jgi:hypothetical protein